MAQVNNKLKLQLFKQAHQKIWEDILEIYPELELTRNRMLNEDFQHRFFTHIEMYGADKVDLEHVTFKLTAAHFGIINSQHGWNAWFVGKTGSLL